jgi:amino acid transporter
MISLRQAVGRPGFFALSFGAVIGSAWIVVLGDWLRNSGPAGTVLGFLAGGVTMVLVALCYGELASQFPKAGGELLYAQAAFGRRVGFLVAWYLTLYTVSACAFEALAFGILVRRLLPFVALPAAYRVGSWPVTWDQLLLDVTAVSAISAIHWRGTRSAIGAQTIITFGFIGIIGVVIFLGLVKGDVRNLLPLFPRSSWTSAALGTLGMFSMSVFFLNGWQAALHAIEERKPDTSVKSAVLWMVGGVALATAFYIGIVLATSSAVPWRTLLGQELPAVTGFQVLGGALLAILVVAAALVSLLKAWIALAWIATRLLIAQARDGYIPRAFGLLHVGSGAPRNAVAFVTVATILGVGAGRSAVLPIVNMTAICLAISIIVCLFAIVRLRRTNCSVASFRVPTGILVCALFAGIAMIGAAVVEPLVRHPGVVPTEWKLIAAWGILGLVAAQITLRRSRACSATPSV